MPTVTENWAKRQYQSGTSAYREYHVDGVADEGEATGAVPFQANANHPLDMFLIAEEPRIVEVIRQEPGGGAYVVGVGFKATEPSEDQSGGGETWPPISCEVDFAEEVEPVEVDAAGHPVVNSAADPFDPPFSMPFSATIIRVFRRERTYDQDKGSRFQNTVNSKQIRFPRLPAWTGGTYAPGTVRLRVYKPTSRIDYKSKFIEACYEFLIRPDGWAARQMLVGFQAFFAGGKKGKLWDGNKREITFPVRLDRQGKPMEAGITVGGQAAIAANPDPLNGVDVENTGNAWFARFVRYKPMDFAGLELGL
jgi:hypothetical protein